VQSHLAEFRLRLRGLWERRSGIDVRRNRKELEEVILECWRQAYEYGFIHHFVHNRDGYLLHVIEGRDIRAGVLIGLAQHLEKLGVFPQPPFVRYCHFCRGLIIPLLYRGRRYCSDACRRRATENDRSRLADMIYTKSRRMVKRGKLTREKREAMLKEIREEKTPEGIRQIAMRYGVDPTPGKAGRPSKQ